MDSVDRQRYKHLANDALIEYFGRSDRPAQLAGALEKCVEELQWLSGGCTYCSYCEDRGDKAGEKPKSIDASEVLEIHSQLEERLVELQSVSKSLANTEWVERDGEIDKLDEQLGQLKTDISELQRLVIP